MIAPLTVRNSFGMSSSARPQSYQDGKTIPRCPQFWDSLWMMWLRYHFQTIPCFYIGILQEKRKNKSTVVAIVHGIHHATLQHRRSFTFRGYIILSYTIPVIITLVAAGFGGCLHWRLPIDLVSHLVCHASWCHGMSSCVVVSHRFTHSRMSLLGRFWRSWTWTSWTMDLANSIWLEVLSNKM